MQPQLAERGLTVAGKGSGFNHELGALALRTVERNEKEVQVDRERIHGHDFFWLRYYDGGEVCGGLTVVGHPGPPALEMGFYAVLTPVFEFTIDDFAGALGLQPQGVSCKIQRGASAVRGDVEALAEGREDVALVQALSGCSEFTFLCPIVVEGHGRWNGVVIGACLRGTGR